MLSNDDNVSLLLNSAQIFAIVGRSSDARRNVAKAMQLGVSDYGAQVAYEALGRASLGDGNYVAAYDSFKKAFKYGPSEWTMMMYLYSSAKTKDLEAFREAQAECSVKPETYYQAWACDIDPLTAYLLVLKGRREEAVTLAAKWKDDQQATANIKRYWTYTAGASDILSNWWKLTEEAKKASEGDAPKPRAANP